MLYSRKRWRFDIFYLVVFRVGRGCMDKGVSFLFFVVFIIGEVYI